MEQLTGRILSLVELCDPRGYVDIFGSQHTHDKSQLIRDKSQVETKTHVMGAAALQPFQ